MPAKRKKKLRLVKVVIQPIFVLDDGHTLEEQISDPITVAGSEWEGYPDQLEVQRVELEARLNNESG